MTEKTLEVGEVQHLFMDIFYTPHGESTSTSKIHVLRELGTKYKKVKFFDDDPRTVLRVAKSLSGVEVEYMFHTLTSLLVPAESLANQPNVKYFNSGR